MKEHAAVLGCGPAGLLAAEGLRRQGWHVTVLSRKVFSPMGGAQYLHEPIPGITSEEPQGTLEYFKVGDRDGYAAKVYGNPKADCSWEKFPEGSLPAWSLKMAYEQLWFDWEDYIVEVNLKPDNVDVLADQYQLVVSTIPSSMLCKAAHTFESRQIWLRDEAQADCPEDTIIYHGDPMQPWYRTSRIFGVPSTEYSHAVTGAKTGFKPLRTDCDCHPWIHRMGRFGKWRKGVLVHHVWDEVNCALYAL